MMVRSRANELPEIVARLGSRSPARVDAARARLSIIGARAVEALIEALEGDNNRVRDRVMPLLALIQDSRGREPLIAMLLDRSAKLRATAAQSLARFPSPDSVVALNRVLRRDVSTKVRVAAALALVELYSAGEESALGALLDILLDIEEEKRVRIAALALVPALHPSQRKGVIKGLEKEGSQRITRKLALVMAHHQTGESRRGADVDKWLERLASDEYTDWNAAVQRLGAHGATMVKPLIEAMRSRSHDPEYCTRAGMVLKTLGPRRARAVAEALEYVEEPLPLQVLVDVIGAIGEKSMIYRLKDLIDLIAERCPDSDESSDFDPLQRVRARAHLELARIGSRVAVRDLHDCLADKQRRLELEIFGALELIGNRQEIGLLLSVYTREDEFARERVADIVRAVMKRERIRRNDRLVTALSPRQRKALMAILPPVRPRPVRRQLPRRARKSPESHA